MLVGELGFLFLLVFVSFYFRLFLFSFLFIFLSSRFRFFRCFYCWLYFFFHYCFFTVFVVTASATDIWEGVFYSQAFFTLHSFLRFGTTYFYQGFPVAAVQLWRLQGFPLRFETQTHPICSFESDSVPQLYNKHRTLFKLVNKLL